MTPIAITLVVGTPVAFVILLALGLCRTSARPMPQEPDAEQAEYRAVWEHAETEAAQLRAEDDHTLAVAGLDEFAAWEREMR